MKKIITMACILLLSSCAEPKVNTDERYIGLIQDKAYSLPYNIDFTHNPLSSNRAKVLTNAGIPCREGDIEWNTRDLKSIGNRTGSRDGALKVMYSFYKQGKLNCEHPLSKKEYANMVNSGVKVYDLSSKKMNK